jgi:hypothetical protein
MPVGLFCFGSGSLPSTRRCRGSPWAVGKFSAISTHARPVTNWRMEARTDVSMLLGLIFLLLVGGGTLALDARYPEGLDPK